MAEEGPRVENGNQVKGVVNTETNRLGISRYIEKWNEKDPRTSGTV
jgi:hypothetical protein